MTDFFDEHVIRDNETAQLVASAGRYGTFGPSPILVLLFKSFAENLSRA